MKNNKNKAFTVSNIVDKLRKTTEVQKVPWASTIRRYLRNHLNLRYKRVSWRPKVIETEEKVRQRLEYIKFILTARSEGFIVIQIDEFTVSRNSYPRMSWCQLGISCYVTQHLIQEKFNVISAISNSDVELAVITKRNTNRDVFLEFIVKLISVLREKYKKQILRIILTWDGARYHLVSEVNEFIKKEGVMMVQTIAYTPEFSAVEIFINCVKNKIRKKIRQQK